MTEKANTEALTIIFLTSVLSIKDDADVEKKTHV